MKTLIVIFCLISTAIVQAEAQTKAEELRYRLSTATDFPHPIPMTIDEIDHAVQKKSVSTAGIYSFIMPGMGEWYVDRFDQGRYSIIAEGSLWLTYIFFQQYGTWMQDDARNFAVAHAGVSMAGKNDQFFIDIGNFSDIYAYNEKKLRDRDLSKVYDPALGYNWKWDSELRRLQYRSSRISAETIFNNSRFVLGAIVVNHVISAVNAMRLARQYNRSLNEGLGSWWLESSLLGSAGKVEGVQISLVRQL